jgi:hypothetical protein
MRDGSVARNSALAHDGFLTCNAGFFRQLGCDPNAKCTDQSGGGVWCSCPTGYAPGTSDDGSKCIDSCFLANRMKVLNQSEAGGALNSSLVVAFTVDGNEGSFFSEDVKVEVFLRQ